jgi:hypothetical protein
MSAGAGSTQVDQPLRDHRDAIRRFALSLLPLLQAQERLSEGLAIPIAAALTRGAKRGGLRWLAGPADVGWSNRVGWYEGFHLRLGVTAMGVITGFGFGSASTRDQHLAASLFAARRKRYYHYWRGQYPCLFTHVGD